MLLRRTAVVFLFLFPLMSLAGNDEEVIRVGWHEAPYFMKDQFGRRAGYSYEYQQKLAAYTGWRYEYVEGGWSELLEMLRKGDIDLLANVSYTEERARNFLYASLPMGTEVYYVFVAPDNAAVTSADYTSLNGKTVGVAKDSIQSEMFRRWAESHNVRPELVELTSTEEESLHMLGNKLDAFVTMDVNIAPRTAVPVWKIGSSDYYFAVASGRADLLPRLNAAMSSIQDENILYAQQLSRKYFKDAKANLFLSSEEKSWLKEHGKIRVGYQDNYLAFCARDPVTRELTGTLRNYLDYASYAFENAHLDFEAIPYTTVYDAMEALRNGEIDCLFPVNLVTSDAEELGMITTPPLMKTKMEAVVRDADKMDFFRRDQVTAAVNRGNTNYEMYLRERFPHWQIKYFPDTATGLEAIASGEADALLLSNYRVNNVAKQCRKLDLTTVDTDAEIEYYIALRRGDAHLYSILAKTTAIVPESAVHAALTHYSAEDARTGFIDVIIDNLVAVLLGIVSVVLLILLLLGRSIRAEKKVTDGELRIKALSSKVFVDALTHVRNKGGYDEYINHLQNRLDSGESFGIAIGIFDCDNLKGINDRYGHDKGNIYLQTSCSMICRVFQHSPVFRIGGDEFVVIFLGGDYEIRDQLIKQFQERQAATGTTAQNDWEKVGVSCGVAVYDPSLDGSLKELARRADQLMYEDKSIRKSSCDIPG